MRSRLSAIALSSIAGCVAAIAANTATPAVTFHKDVLPVLQKNCQECHRPGEAGPMQFLDYKGTRPWAKAIKQAVQKGSMPPWFADPAHGRFQNDRRLTDTERNILVAWADSGAPEGKSSSAANTSSAKTWVEGWNIGEPDALYQLPKPFEIPAQGTIDYHYVILPTGFTEDKWIERAEVRPGNRALNHHVIAFIRPPGSKWFANQKPGEIFLPERPARRQGRNEGTSEDGGGMIGVELLVGYAPGLQAQLSPAGTAKLVKAGSDIVLQLHYTANGTAGTDLTRIGLTFAKEPPKYRQLTMNATNNRFVIPAGAGSHEVKSSITLHEDTNLLWLMPHMHLRGKDFKYTAVYPSGESEVLLNVPRYDFNWQLGYVLKEPKVLPKGTRIDCIAHFDNSPNNPANPDPKSEVRWGDQSWEEMMIGWFDVAIDPKTNVIDIYRPKKTEAPAAKDTKTSGE